MTTASAGTASNSGPGAHSLPPPHPVQGLVRWLAGAPARSPAAGSPAQRNALRPADLMLNINA
jgi:hypothetical protein